MQHTGAHAGMTFADSVVDLMGDTPLVRLGRVTDGLAPLVLAKVEYLNPGGSVKDRPALRMIRSKTPASAQRWNQSCTVLLGGNSLGSSDHWQPVLRT